MDKARTAALSALLRIREDEGYSNIVLDKTIRSFKLESRDAAFTSALFYGVLERRIALDYCISLFSKMQMKKMEPIVQEILRMGVFQILYMEKVPDSAAVNESVVLAKENKAVKASGFINGILRNLLRRKDSITWPEENSNMGKSIRYSCPEEWILFWTEAYGSHICDGILQSLKKKPPLYIRMNPCKTSDSALETSFFEAGVEFKKIPWIKNAYALNHTGSVSDLKSFSDGWFHVQDLSSQLCCCLFGGKAEERIIDVCAAPGGKTFTIAEDMENKGELFSFDKYKGKVRLIREGAERLGLSIVKAAVRDAALPKEPLQAADRVLCDVPCSGLGVIRRKPEIRYKSLKELDSLPDLQYLILCESSKLVRPNGRLVYSTCTLNPKENGDIADRFLKNHPDFESVHIDLPKGVLRQFPEPDNQITVFPQTMDSDGFFIAVFQRKQE